MRERMARVVALLTLVSTLALALLFAWSHRSSDAGPGDAELTEASVAAPDPALIVRGRALVEREGCLRCHAIAGEGNPRNPLDGIGGRRDARGIRQWIVADPAISDGLSPGVAQAKQRYQGLPEADLATIVAYLQGLR